MKCKKHPDEDMTETLVSWICDVCECQLQKKWDFERWSRGLSGNCIICGKAREHYMAGWLAHNNCWDAMSQSTRDEMLDYLKIKKAKWWD